MENYRDTPLARFTTFWWGLALICSFGIIAVVLRPILHSDANDMNDLEESVRLATKEKIVEAQKEKLVAKKLGASHVQLPPQDVFIALAPKLIAKTPEPVRVKEQAVPGTETFKKLNSGQ